MKKITHVSLLPDTIIPSHYKILLTPDLDNFTFVGEEVISVEIKREVREIKLHSAELEILSVEIVFGKKKLTGKVAYDDKNEMAILSFSEKIPAGQAKLKLEFTGILNDRMRGFYRSSYEIDGKQNHMAVTQFESTDARRAIPCFDEPHRKAVFEVSLIVPSDRTVISNTIDQEIKEHSAGMKLVSFAPTPKMSTYLLALIVGHFEHIEIKSKRGVLVRIFVTPGKKNQANFALSVAQKTVDYLEDYFDIAYPLPTLDLVAIPDFASGAMENWGAITYRENALLIDPTHSSKINKQWVALVIAHEIAHQWFGNLVTMEWWTHLWLNEGFASYMEYVAVDHLFPEWDIWTQFVHMEQGTALELDALANTHPIEIEVHHPKEIVEIFDAVSYSKGASVIRMIAEFLGENDFRKGLRIYLKTHAYGNAATEDLWKALEKASGKPVRKIMDHWVKKGGYPYVTVEEKKNKISLTQARFYSSAISANQLKSDDLWLIPVSILTSDSEIPKFHFLQKQAIFILRPEEARWIKADYGEVSFIRVLYEEKLLNALGVPIEKGDPRLKEVDRFGILRDLFTLSEAGKVSTDRALAFTKYFRNETSYIIWSLIVSELKKIENVIAGQAYQKDFRKFALMLLTEIVEKIGWEKKKGEDHTTTFLRSTVLYAAGYNGDKKVVKKAQELFQKMGPKLKIEPDLKGVVYILVAENGGELEYRRFLEMYKKEELSEEKNRIMRALASFRDPKLLKETLDFTFSSDVRPQDTFRGVEIMATEPFSIDIAWEFVKDNWETIAEKFAETHILPHFVSGFSSFVSDEKADELEKFFESRITGDIRRTVAQTLEQIRSNAAWKTRDSGRIRKFLQNTSKVWNLK